MNSGFELRSLVLYHATINARKLTSFPDFCLLSPHQSLFVMKNQEPICSKGCTIGNLSIFLTPELSTWLLKRKIIIMYIWHLSFQEKEKHVLCLARKLYGRNMFGLIIYVNPTSVCLKKTSSSFFKKNWNLSALGTFFLHLVLTALEENTSCSQQAMKARSSFTHKLVPSLISRWF